MQCSFLDVTSGKKTEISLKMASTSPALTHRHQFLTYCPMRLFSRLKILQINNII